MDILPFIGNEAFDAFFTQWIMIGTPLLIGLSVIALLRN
jgi:hypothetical protein